MDLTHRKPIEQIHSPVGFGSESAAANLSLAGATSNTIKRSQCYTSSDAVQPCGTLLRPVAKVDFDAQSARDSLCTTLTRNQDFFLIFSLHSPAVGNI